jgi:hypothetical protein
MRGRLLVATGVSGALLLLASGGTVVSFWYSLRRFGASEFALRAAGLAICRELAASHALLVVCLHLTGVFQVSPPLARRRTALIAAATVPLAYLIVAAIEGSFATVVARVLGIESAMFDLVTIADAGRGLVLALALAPFAALFVFLGIPRLVAWKRGLGMRLLVTWLAVLAVTTTMSTIARFLAGSPTEVRGIGELPGLFDGQRFPR